MTENVFDSSNIALSANNNLTWNILGINMIKWFKNIMLIVDIY